MGGVPLGLASGTMTAEAKLVEEVWSFEDVREEERKVVVFVVDAGRLPVEVDPGLRELSRDGGLGFFGEPVSREG